jgi:3-deoxy-D-manno-octulosonate 8-phosphate phosphatase (KDO 8-P phosphatase)
MTLPADQIDARIRRLRLLLLDVDGVLTDGTVNVGSGGEESKAFFIRDGAAIKWLQRDGLPVGLLSGRSSGATSRRAAELGIRIVWQEGADKRRGLDEILAAERCDPIEVAYMGDDVLDLPVLTRVGLSAAPADAVEEVRARVDFVSRFAGGRGAVRELIERILRGRGRWDALVQGMLD